MFRIPAPVRMEFLREPPEIIPDFLPVHPMAPEDQGGEHPGGIGRIPVLVFQGGDVPVLQGELYQMVVPEGVPFGFAEPEELPGAFLGLGVEAVLPEGIVAEAIGPLLVFRQNAQGLPPVFRKGFHRRQDGLPPLLQPLGPRLQPLGLRRQEPGKERIFRQLVGRVEGFQILRRDFHVVEQSVAPGTDPEFLEFLRCHEMIPEEPVLGKFRQAPGLGVQELGERAVMPSGR